MLESGGKVFYEMNKESFLLLGVCGAFGSWTRSACRAQIRSGAFGQNTRQDLRPNILPLSTLIYVPPLQQPLNFQHSDFRKFLRKFEAEVLSEKQARKSSEDTHFTEYAWFEKVWAG